MTPEAYTTELRNLNANPGDNYVRDFESVLEKCWKLQDPGCIPLMCAFFDDEADYPELMDTIMQFVESFPDEVYTRQLLMTTPSLRETAPGWASTMYARIMNSEEILAELIHQAKTVAPEIKASVRKVIEQIVAEAPERQSKAAKIMAVLQDS